MIDYNKVTKEICGIKFRLDEIKNQVALAEEAVTDLVKQAYFKGY